MPYLQGQLSADISSITPEHSALSVYCTPKGRVLTTARVFMHNTQYYLLLPKDLCTSIQATLQKYIMISDVQIIEAQEWHIYGCIDPVNAPDTVNTQSTHANGSLSICVATHPHRCLYITETPPQGSISTDITSWHSLDIAAGIPHICLKTQELFTPHMLNYDRLGGISFTKGCFTGQEVIARTQHRGSSKRRLYRAHYEHIPNPLQPGDPIHKNDTVVGTVVNTAGQDMLLVLHETALTPPGLAAEHITVL